MKSAAFSILLAAAATFALPAFAQDSGGSSAPYYSSDGLPTDNGAGEVGSGSAPWGVPETLGNGYRISIGIDALHMNDFVAAETAFAEALRRDRNNAELNLYMGVTRMSLGKWDDAKKHLEIALRKNPKHPDPKSRLGVTYAKLGDTEAANALRADLVKMSNACRNDCRLSPYISNGIRMIDEALNEKQGAMPVGRG